MARAEGIEIEEIVLHPFGGLARLKTDPQNRELNSALPAGHVKLLVCHPRFRGYKDRAVGNYESTVVVFS